MTHITRRQAVTAALCAPTVAAPLPAAAEPVTEPRTPLRAAYAAWREADARLDALHREADAFIETFCPEPAWVGRRPTDAEVEEWQATEAAVQARFGIPEAEDRWCATLDAMGEVIVGVVGDSPDRVWDAISCVQCRAGRV